jgi:bifunctional non-homologous end joining protein LigD
MGGARARGRTVRFGAYTVELTHLDKILFPADGITKSELVSYYREVAGRMIPRLRDRPLVMERYPDGVERDGFYQKDVPDSFPDWIRRVRVAKVGGTVTHALCRNEATLVYLANQDCITLHRWLATADDVGRPDRLVFDLDPGAGFDQARDGAHWLRQLLLDIGLAPFVMTTGGRGLHVVVPIAREAGFDDVRNFAMTVAKMLVSEHPDRLTVATRHDARGDRLYLDCFRNGYAQTAVAPYSIRARAHAPVAMPLTWAELDDPGLRSDTYRIRNVRRRLSSVDDPWRGLARHARSLEEPAARLAERRA